MGDQRDDDNGLKLAAAGAGAAGLLAILMTRRLPRPLRVVLVIGLFFLACAAGVIAYRLFTKPTTLTVAVAFADSNGTKLMQAVAARMAANGAPIRLTVVDKKTASDATRAMATGETNLAIARADAENIAGAQSIVVMTHNVVLIVAPPGSPVSSIDELKGKTVGVIAADINKRVVDTLSAQYRLAAAQVRFKDLTMDAAASALRSKQIDALLVVMPLSERYLSWLHTLFPRSAKRQPVLIEIESATAIATIAPYYEAFDVPKGALQGSPAVPEEDTTTLRVPFYLVANKKLSNMHAASLAKSIMEARRDLLQDYPVLAQVSAPNTDKETTDVDVFVPIHPGAAAFFNGEQQSFIEKYGDMLFYGSTILGFLASVLAGAWKFVVGDKDAEQKRPASQVYDLIDDVEQARSVEDLDMIEDRLDDILRTELERDVDEDQPSQAAELQLATRRVERAIEARRAALEDA